MARKAAVVMSQLTVLVLARCVSLEGRLRSFNLDDNVYRRFVSRVRNKKKRAESQRRKDEHLV